MEKFGWLENPNDFKLNERWILCLKIWNCRRCPEESNHGSDLDCLPMSALRVHGWLGFDLLLPQFLVNYALHMWSEFGLKYIYEIVATAYKHLGIWLVPETLDRKVAKTNSKHQDSRSSCPPHSTPVTLVELLAHSDMDGLKVGTQEILL